MCVDVIILIMTSSQHTIFRTFFKTRFFYKRLEQNIIDKHLLKQFCVFEAHAVQNDLLPSNRHQNNFKDGWQD